MNLLIAAQSGWGKSHLLQEKAEKNIIRVDYSVILDWKDEYRGLVKGGLSSWFIAGPNEVNYSPAKWAKLIEDNHSIVIAKYKIDSDGWKEITKNISLAVQGLYEKYNGSRKIFIAIDEAHEVAPERKGYPEPIRQLATMGRGQNISTIWATQRLALLSKNVTAECMAVYAGGFTDRNDLDALRVDYPTDIHNPRVSGFRENQIPEQLVTDTKNGLVPPVRKWLDGDKVIGSEWIYSDETGTIRREDRRNTSMKTTHYGHSGWRLSL